MILLVGFRLTFLGSMKRLTPLAQGMSWSYAASIDLVDPFGM